MPESSIPKPAPRSMRRPLPNLLVAIAAAAISASSCAAPAPESAPSVPAAEPVPVHVSPAAPDSFTVLFETSKGPFTVMAYRHWSPTGVDRLHELVTTGFFDDARFFRVVPGFVAQFGLPSDPGVAASWRERTIADDEVRTSNARGTLSFARSGPGTRSTQLFINLRDNARLDALNGFGFPPIGRVITGMDVVDALYSGYGEGAPRGRGPVQDSIRLQGNPYLDRAFPRLDAIRSARIVARPGGE